MNGGREFTVTSKSFLTPFPVSQSGLELQARCLGTLALTHDLKEGTLAFLEKRSPDFTGN